MNPAPKTCCKKHCPYYEEKEWQNIHWCHAKKKTRRFKSKDPRRRVPDWCPRVKPLKLRIYTKKYDYEKDQSYEVLRLETDSKISGYDLYKRFEATNANGLAYIDELSELLGVKVKTGETIEIDDGIHPILLSIHYDKKLKLERGYINKDKVRYREDKE